MTSHTTIEIPNVIETTRTLYTSTSNSEGHLLNLTVYNRSDTEEISLLLKVNDVVASKALKIAPKTSYDFANSKIMIPPGGSLIAVSEGGTYSVYGLLQIYNIV